MNRKPPEDHLHDHLLHHYLMFTPCPGARSRRIPSISFTVRSDPKRHYLFFILVYNSTPNVHCQQYGFFFPFPPFHVCIPHIRVPMGPMTFHFLLCHLPIPFVHVSYLRSSYFPNCAVLITEDPFHRGWSLLWWCSRTKTPIPGQMKSNEPRCDD